MCVTASARGSSTFPSPQKETRPHEQSPRRLRQPLTSTRPLPVCGWARSGRFLYTGSGTCDLLCLRPSLSIVCAKSARAVGRVARPPFQGRVIFPSVDRRCCLSPFSVAGPRFRLISPHHHLSTLTSRALPGGAGVGNVGVSRGNSRRALTAWSSSGDPNIRGRRAGRGWGGQAGSGQCGALGTGCVQLGGGPPTPSPTV